MKAITSDFGVDSAEKRWALVRRIMYCSVAVALFANGVDHINHFERPAELHDYGQVVILIYIIAFPALRALGLISQDRWI